MEFYSKAAEKNYPQAQFKLAIAYDEGIGVTRDIHRAVELYSKAAQQGFALAQFNLGYIYANDLNDPSKVLVATSRR